MKVNVSNKITAVILTVCASISMYSASATTDGDGWINLLEDGLTAWQDATGWTTAEEVIVDPANEKCLKVTKEGKAIAVVEQKGNAVYLLSKEMHDDVEAEIEFMVPKGSNSGIYFMGRYEVQILDSFGKKEVNHGDCGGIYQRWGAHQDHGHPPMVNASTAP